LKEILSGDFYIRLQPKERRIQATSETFINYDGWVAEDDKHSRPLKQAE
jgi:hypothetical protein